MTPVSCTRRLEFDAAHRLMKHNGRCKNLHGHRYVVEVHCVTKKLNAFGLVIDFGAVKEIVGQWIDDNWDHACILNQDDDALIEFLVNLNMRHYCIAGEPSAENMATELLHVARTLLEEEQITVSMVRIYETPNAWADAV